MLQSLTNTYRTLAAKLDAASPVLDLLFRLWVANGFFKSGLTKIGNWQATLFLFENEYNVPVLPSNIAALAGTATELTVPVLLALGLASRPAALVLFVFNIVAVVSYPGLSESGMRDHVYWGLMMLVTLFHGPGKLSLDAWIERRIGGRTQPAATTGSTQWAH